MTIIIECSRPAVWRPGIYRSRVIVRAWFGWFAICWLRIPFPEFATTAYDWRLK